MLCAAASQDVAGMDLEVFQSIQESDSTPKQVLACVEQSQCHEWHEIASEDPELKVYQSQWGALKIKQGSCYHQWCHAHGQLLVPRGLREGVLGTVHGQT